MENGIVNSVKKAFDVLDILAFEDPKRTGVSLTELSLLTGIKTNTLHGILKTMIHCGYVEKKNHLYVTGKRCRQIGIINRFQFTPEISNTLNSIIKQLCHITGEGVSFYVLEGGERINYINYQTNALIKVDYTMLSSDSIYDYPSGKILVAYCDENELDMIIRKHGFPNERWNSINDMSTLRKEIEDIKIKEVLKQQTEEATVTSYAIAVFNEDKLLGSLGVYMPSFRETPEKEQLIINELKKSADEIKRIISRR